MKKVKGVDPREVRIEGINSGNSGESGFVKSMEKKTQKKLTVPFIPNVPIPWIQKALLLPGRSSTVKVALLIWYKKGLLSTKKDLVISSSQALKEFGISQRSFSRGLKELESLGMIEITEQGSGKSPRVTVLWQEGE